ncbi:PREDICTED: cyclin N-terminal domain-containing protein 1-like [Priapulus caudatus]|uniref:Cyclin N-terminal domain-containing protein 1-like n=1 Tax=Priapulus caudatus TaxID=37621 RepID=A0ABM1E0M5_PRICU|nr:PREDICTED: cyclin N-terminal domain-containing protein 1-like [Priapulus caudatus]
MTADVRFMYEHVKQLYSNVKVRDSSCKRKDWEEILDKLRHQVPLRALSCLQLASKMSSHYNILTPRKIRTLLKDVGHDYSLAGILNSELRVLKTLDYRICCNTPLLHVDTLLAMLDRFVASLKLDELRRVSIKLLDAAYTWQCQSR